MPKTERTYSFGEYVMYEPGYKEPELGRVTKDIGDHVFVCYHEGCTAASTPRSMLRPATDAEVSENIKRFGYRRFEGSCPSYNPDACAGCEAAPKK